MRYMKQAIVLLSVLGVSLVAADITQTEAMAA